MTPSGLAFITSDLEVTLEAQIPDASPQTNTIGSYSTFLMMTRLILKPPAALGIVQRDAGFELGPLPKTTFSRALSSLLTGLVQCRIYQALLLDSSMSFGIKLTQHIMSRAQPPPSMTHPTTQQLWFERNSTTRPLWCSWIPIS